MSVPSPSPAAPFTVTFASNPAEPVEEGSACVVEAAFANAEGPLTPAAVAYRIDDVDSGTSILGETSVTPGSSVSITVTAAQNAMLSDMLACELHQLTLTVTDGSGNEANAPIQWQVARIFPT